MAQKIRVLSFGGLRGESLKVSPAVLKHKSRQSFIRHLTSHCWGGDFMVPSQFRQERHTIALASWNNNGAGYKKISKT